jgi:hypothetical protein
LQVFDIFNVFLLAIIVDMSFLDERNKPNGKSTQLYYCVNPWEPKHVVGVKHSKLAEFGALDGITSIETSRPAWVRPGGKYQDNPVKIVISGKPSAVDETMRKISAWLVECSSMYHDRFDYRKHLEMYC